MEDIASIRFSNILQDNKLTKTSYQFYRKTPIEYANSCTFSWFTILYFGDTAVIDIQVPTDKWGNNRTRVTMNNKWSYLNGPSTNFAEIIPYKNCEYSLFGAGAKKPHIKTNELYVLGEIEMKVKPDRLFFYLKKGYFNILGREKDYIVVAFYEPIAFWHSSLTKEKKLIKTAKVLFNEDKKVIILPYNAPNELWQNYNKM